MDFFAEIKAYRNWLELNPLKPNTQVLWFHLMMIANESGWKTDLSIPNSTLMARTHLSEKTLIKQRNLLVQLGRITYRSRGTQKAGIYQITPFFTGKIPVSREAKQEAKREVKQGVKVSAYLDIDPDTNQTTPQVSASAPPATNNLSDTGVPAREEVFTSIEKEFGRPLSPIELETVSDWLGQDQYAPEIILLALREAVLNHAFSFKYIDRILLSWEKQNIQTAADVQQMQRKRDHNRQNAVEPVQTPVVNQLPNNIPEIPMYNWADPDQNEGGY
ncbi:DnaD domain protein [Loigolactobacillus coryniformis]|uniref:DnaD domain-containing protein n=1 Tax=Loigolactobacillus coryniformis TaxID=1610 RepID=UPI003F243F81